MSWKLRLRIRGYCRNLSASHRKPGPGPTSAAEKKMLLTIKSWCFNLNLHELLLCLHWHTFVKTNWIWTANSEWQTNLEIWQLAPGPTLDCRLSSRGASPRCLLAREVDTWHMTHAAKLVNLQFEEIIKDITQSSGIFFICSMLMLLTSLTFDLSHYL